MQASINLADTLFIVSSKSGGTTEPNVMKDYFFARVSESDRRRQGRPSLHRRDRSRLVAGEGRGQAGLCPRLLRRSRDRRPLFGAVAVRPGAGRGRRHRCAHPDPAYAGDGALLRAGCAAA